MTFEQTDIKERLQWLVKLRWAGCIGVLVATHMVREIAGMTFPLIPVYQPAGKITISIGVSSYPEDGDSIEKIVKSADDALYGAKNAGRNRVVTAKRT